MIAILADMHGNMPAFEAVLLDMPKISEVWALGDYVTGVPFPCQVLDGLMGLDVPVRSVLGNNDEVLLAKRGKVKGRQLGIFGWVEQVLEPCHWDFLEGLSKSLPLGDRALLYHGTPEEIAGAVIKMEDAEKIADAHSQKWLVGGHRHVQRLFRVGEQYVIIPGSVGISVDGIGGLATYALLDEATGKLAFRSVTYDVAQAVEAIEKSPIIELSPGIAKCVRKELLTGRLYIMSLVKFAFEYAEKQLGYRPEEVPFDMWNEAEEKWDGSEWDGK